ncbi:MAG TPA: GxxExxY protein [Gemmatimonadaceae bacterium]|nr:GxxExxY protein [Gemmatimonadaceae bacterium]
MEIDDITGVVVDAAVKIHRDLGSSLFESVYEVALAVVLERRGLRVVRQQSIGFSYEGVEFERAFRADLVVETCVLIEVKVVDRLTPIDRTQLLTYLRLGGFPVGLLLNFGAGTMKDGMKRLVNDLPPSASSPLRVNRRRPARGPEPRSSRE